LLIAIGVTVNSFSGLFNSVVNAGFRLFSDTVTQELLIGYASDDDPVSTGIYVSYFIKKFFNFEVPDYQLGSVS
jgi:hypothetical protein